MSSYSPHRKWGHYTSAYRGKGVSRAHVPRVVLYLLIVLAAAALILFGVALHLQQYMVYSREGGVMVLPGEEEAQPPPAEDNLLIGLKVLEETAQPDSPATRLRAVQLSIPALLAGNAADTLAKSGGNALILDMKPVSGVLCWNTDQAPEGAKIPVSGQAAAIESAIAGLQSEGFYLIARLHCFRDEALADDSPELTLPDGGEDEDAPFSAWLDPSLPEVQEYLSGLAGELAALGFDEILLSDGAYPDGWENGDLPPEDRAEAVDQFYALAASALGRNSGVKLGVETQESVLRSGKPSASGQSTASLLSRADRIWCAGDGQADFDQLFSQEQLQAGMLVWTGSAFREEDPPSPAQAILTQ